MSLARTSLLEPVIISRAVRRPSGTPPTSPAEAPRIREMPFSSFQEHTDVGLWSEDIVFVETFAQSYKSMHCVAGMSLTLELGAKSILVSHTEESAKDAETTGGLRTSPCPLPPGGPPASPSAPPVETSWSFPAPNTGCL